MAEEDGGEKSVLANIRIRVGGMFSSLDDGQVRLSSHAMHVAAAAARE
jgi:hypothetical protein